MSKLSPRAASILEFLQICDQFKLIERQSWLTGGTRMETDAEHCWHMTLFALLLSEELETKVDIARTLALITVHDLVEIYTGDAYAFDYSQLDQEAKESAAAERLFSGLPPDVRALVHGWWREFEDGNTPEAKFARSLDRLQAFNQSILSRGKDWRLHNVRRESTEKRMGPARTFDPAITALVDHLYSVADREGLWSQEHT